MRIRFVAPFVFAISAIFAPTTYSAYTGPGADKDVTTVAAIKKAPQDDRWVVLKGHIIRKDQRKMYTFSDGTGEIAVKIHPKEFPRQEINNKTRVEIVGEQEMGHGGKVYVDAEAVRVLK